MDVGRKIEMDARIWFIFLIFRGEVLITVSALSQLGNSNFKVPIIWGTMSEVSALAVAPNLMQLFWSVQEPFAAIECSLLDGTSRRAIVLTGIYSPTSLAVDEPNRLTFIGSLIFCNVSPRLLNVQHLFAAACTGLMLKKGQLRQLHWLEEIEKWSRNTDTKVKFHILYLSIGRSKFHHRNRYVETSVTSVSEVTVVSFNNSNKYWCIRL